MSTFLTASHRMSWVTYLTHACMELTLGRKGPAFARGWWLLHEHPADSMETVRWADLIYFSNMHSDHLRYTEKMAPDLAQHYLSVILFNQPNHVNSILPAPSVSYLTE
ncbi:cytidine monophosphate-N-acetylneuraminic acid hydroxylase [Esox lucius]|uniref:cytidine monophosphate-N-acetylneuraminic acid hydroxylase n=1 Tax=Esox lucius TaxID=8010 RepID=UPI001476BC79|nr:cytidine monophosphate-N-acetylneuraminic acid hydroxylase [Esox lucius]